MRVLYVVHNAPPLLSGRAMQALMLAGSLNRRPGVEVFSISLDQRPVDAPPRSPIRMRLDVWQVRRVLLRLLWTCIRERVSAVHFHGHHYAAHLTAVLRPLGIRCYLHMTNKGFDDPATLLDGRGSRLQRYALQRLSAWIVQNPDDLPQGRAPDARPRIVNIPNAVAPPRPRLDTGDLRSIVLSGVICARKGQLDMLRVFAELPNAVRAGLRLRLAGSYSDDYWEYDADYVAQCRALADLIPQAALLGHLTKDALMDELRQAHYFLAISSAEGLSNAYLECLSQGLLPICYEDRHDPLFETLDLVDDLIRVPRGDPKIASAALIQSLGRHPWSQTRAAEIQSRVAERFGLERIADRLLALYRDPTAPV